MPQSVIQNAKDVITIELEAIRQLLEHIDEKFDTAVKYICECKGRVIVTGMGKSGLVGRKIAATMSSTGTATFFMNPAEGIHGDLGVIMKEDVMIAISKGGETEEINRIIPFVKRQGNKLIAITSSPDSTLGKNANVVLTFGTVREACPHNLAPTSSTTATLVLGDALAIALLKAKNFSEEDFAMLHPGGSLGRKFMRVEDIMHSGDSLPVVALKTTVLDTLHEIISKKLGVAMVINDDGTLAGILVDGDLKRLLIVNKHDELLSMSVDKVMVRNPKTIGKNALCVEALQVMEGKITSLIVVDEGHKPIGLIHIHDLMKAKLI